ncbi:MAG TPA: hypothetical protein VL295_02425, partial [Gemmatimonadales bacterium]|nr:hypothetical protein [Gemmatimonadales bacterium]
PIGYALIFVPLLISALRRIHERKLWAAAAQRLLIGGVMVAVMMWLAMGIDQGRFAGQSHLERSVMVLGMMIVGFSGVIICVSIISLEERTWDLPFQAMGWVAVAVLVIGLLSEGGDLMERHWGIYHERIFYAALAIAIITATLIRPWWFWEHAKARFVRDIIGDHSTIVLYLLIAGGFGWWAVFRPWGPEHAHRRSQGHFSGRIVTCYHLEGDGVDAADLGDQVAYAPGFETGFAIWMPRAEFGDTTRRIAYDGRWHRTPGDTTLIRIEQDGNGSVAEIMIAPGPFPRSGTIELPAGAVWGNVTTGRVIPVRVDSTGCAVEIVGHG